MFRPTIRSVVPMDYSYLARSDGSEQSQGRGSGLDIPSVSKRRVPRTPYMNMVYAPLERRLDTAIFRALFASSTRQARQFVVHGAVKVNGKKVGCKFKNVSWGVNLQASSDDIPRISTKSR